MSAEQPPATAAVTPVIDEEIAKKFLLDPYNDWAAGEGIPVHLDFGHDLLALETGRWDRYDAKGCFAHTHGRGDFMSNYVIEIDPGKKTRPASKATRRWSAPTK